MEGRFLTMDSPLSPGIVYTLTLSSLAGGQSSVAMTANLAPSGGVLIACLLDGAEGCIGVGEPLVDTFRLELPGWSDSDGGLTYQFGYSVIRSSLSNETASVWFDRQVNRSQDVENPLRSKMS